MILMKDQKPKKPAKRPPSRDNYVYVYIPKPIAEKLQAIADQEERSLSFMVKKAVERFLERP